MISRSITHRLAQAFAAFGLVFVLAGTPHVQATPALGSEQALTAVPSSLAASTTVQIQVIEIAVGGNHTCALTSAGGAKCWGWNGFGQIGNGRTTDRKMPADVSGLAGGVALLAAGGVHTCALTGAGGAKCWGDNSFGQLGDGTLIQHRTPVDVSGLASGVAALAAGGNHTCALTNVGGVKCWGDNEYGQLGDGTVISRTLPVDVSGLASGVTALALGTDHTCAVTGTGGVKCWGYNLFGQLGDGTFIDSLIPVDVSELTSGVTALAAGDSHTCAVTGAGGVKCWGWNGVGQLGNGTTTNSFSTPMDVSGLASGVTAVTAGKWHSCAVTNAGGVKCWGANLYGELGDGTTVSRSRTPVDVSGLASGIAALAAGGRHACVITSAGAMKCWGDNGFGQLGDDTFAQRRTPVNVLWPQSLYMPLVSS